MKKHLLTLIIILFSSNIFAQGHWKEISSGIIENATTSSDFTWLIFSKKISKINNKTNSIVDITYPSTISNINFCLSNNDELWLWGSNIIHYKNGIWNEVPNSSILNYHYGALNHTTGNIISCDYIANSFTTLISNNLKSIPISFDLKINSNVILADNNRIFYNSNFSATIYEIDTNGILKNKFDNIRLGISSTSINGMQLDSNQNLYVHFTDDGIYKAKLGLSDTSFHKIISQSKLDSLDIKAFKIDRNNNIVIERHGWLNDTLFTVFSPSGKEISNQKVITNTSNFQYYFTGFNHLNNPIVIQNNNVWESDSLEWNSIYKSNNKYEGDVITNSAISINNRIFLTSNFNNYRIDTNKVEKLEIDSTYIDKIIDSRSIISDQTGDLYLINNNQGYLELVKMKWNSKIKLESKLPDTLTSAHILDGKRMIFNKDSKLCILMNNHILVYDSPNNWDTIPTRTSDNISELYSFCKDGNGNIWVGTDKGVARVINNQIEIETKILANYKITTIKYLPNINSLIFSNNPNSGGNICTYNLQLETITSTHTFYPIDLIVPLNNSNLVYIQYNSEKIWRYNVVINKWDTAFNNHIANTPFNYSQSSGFIIDKNDNLFLFTKDLTHSDMSIYIYNENGFSSINSTKNKLETLHIYPNPTSGVFTIDSKENYTAYFIYNLLGRLLKNGEIENKKIDISEISSGVYTLKLVGKKGESFRRIVKN